MNTSLNNDAKKFLKQIERSDYLIEQKRNLITEIRASLGAKAIRYDSDGVPKSLPDPESNARKYAKLTTLEQELEDDIMKHMFLKRDVLNVINKIDDVDEVKLLTCRYVYLIKTWERVAVEIGYSLRNTHRIHSRALKSISNILSQNGTKESDNIVS